MAEPQIAREVLMLDMASIDWTPGLRPIDPVWVEGLAALMKHDGQRTPIKVHRKADGRFGLIAGRHRFKAVETLGWATIDGELFEGSALERRAEEVAENLHRGGLSPLDRAAFVAEAVEIAKVKAGVDPTESAQKLAAEARWSKRVGMEADDASATVAHAYGFSDQVAETLGLSRRAIYRDLELHRGLQADVVETVRALPIGGNAAQLRALARLDDRSQREAVALLTGGQAKSVADAVGILKQKPLPDPAKKAFSAAVSNYARLSAADQRAFLRAIKLPKGAALTLDGEAV
jgi:ParB family transcriptional regulator, chromosome partitioning protein